MYISDRRFHKNCDAFKMEVISALEMLHSTVLLSDIRVHNNCDVFKVEVTFALKMLHLSVNL